MTNIADGVPSTSSLLVITNSLLYRTINTTIIKLDISDHFPIFLIAETEERMTWEGSVQITKRLINNKTNEQLKNALEEMLTKSSSIN